MEVAEFVYIREYHYCVLNKNLSVYQGGDCIFYIEEVFWIMNRLVCLYTKFFGAEGSEAAVPKDKYTITGDSDMKIKCFKNRELSWLDFNKRVLEEAADSKNPLCERMTFASIFKSNLDEFFMVRVGMLYDSMLFDNDPKENKTNMKASEQLCAIAESTRKLMAECDDVFDEIMGEALCYGVRLVNFNNLSKSQSIAMEKYFDREILPLLSPQIVGRKHPFPFLINKEIYVLVALETKKNNEKIGIIPCNTGVFSRLIPALDEEGTFMLAEELILHYVAKVFNGYKIKEKSVMRIVRNADINTDEAFNDDVDYRDAMERIIKKRKKLCPVKLEFSRKLSSETIKYMCSMLNLAEERVFRSTSPLDLSFVSELQDFLKDKKELFYTPVEPQPSYMIDENESIIEQIRKKDVLLSYPYESMKPFLKMLEEAAHDPSVVSIKMTLYRVAKYSKIVETLISAAENGKEVVVIVELRARFDEENNIEWSKRLEDAGCRIIYGLDFLKVHSKLCLIARKTQDAVEYISQIGTGNYNEKTAKQYTDYSLMTSSYEIGKEVANVLNELAIGRVVEESQHLLVAPKCLQNKVLDMIDDEIEKAKQGFDAYVGAKINSLTDKKIIDKLIDASEAGVKVELIVRGICCLVPGIKDYTENIVVKSIVGRFLEHSRVYIFGAGADPRLYISSADYMTRNTIHRVEVAVPIYDRQIKKRILHMFDVMMRDNVKARIMQSNGRYVRFTDGTEEPLNSQEYFYREAYARAARPKTEEIVQ